MRLTETLVLCFVVACFTYYKIETKKEEMKQKHAVEYVDGGRK